MLFRSHLAVFGVHEGLVVIVLATYGRQRKPEQLQRFPLELQLPVAACTQLEAVQSILALPVVEVVRLSYETYGASYRSFVVAIYAQYTYSVAPEKVHNVQLLYTARHSMHYRIVSDIDTCMCQPVPVRHDKILQLLP